MATASTPLRPLRRDAAANRARMLEAAERVFAEQGLDASVDAVIDAAGVGAGTFYRRFPDKDALVAELIGSIEQRLAALLDHAMAACGDGTGLEWFMFAAGEELQHHRGLLRRLWHDDRSPEHVAHIRRNITRLLRAAQQQGRISEQVAPADISTTLWAVSGIIETTAEISPDIWKRHLHATLEGMRSPGLRHEQPPLSAAQLAAVTCTDRPSDR